MEVHEGLIEIRIPEIKKLNSKAKVFYNSVMQLNRDLNVLLLASIERKTRKPLRVLDLLAASGVRGLRIAKEVGNAELTLNDYKKECYEAMKRNAKINRVKAKIENLPAHVLLARLEPYDYIDVDPFGTPAPFLDAAIKRLSPHGILGVTATDTALLCGTYPKACRRVYGACPLRNEFSKEVGLRILIKKVQEVAAQYEVALTPIFSHASNHYMRAYFQKSTGAGRTDSILEKQGFILYCWGCLWREPVKPLFGAPTNCPKCGKLLDWAGPLWLGKLWDEQLTKRMLALAFKRKEISREARKLLETISQEAKISAVGFYDLHWLAKKHKWKQVPKLADFLEKVGGTRTHFSENGFRCSMRLNKSFHWE